MIHKHEQAFRNIFLWLLLAGILSGCLLFGPLEPVTRLRPISDPRTSEYQLNDDTLVARIGGETLKILSRAEGKKSSDEDPTVYEVVVTLVAEPTRALTLETGKITLTDAMHQTLKPRVYQDNGSLDTISSISLEAFRKHEILLSYSSSGHKVRLPFTLRLELSDTAISSPFVLDSVVFDRVRR